MEKIRILNEYIRAKNKLEEYIKSGDTYMSYDISKALSVVYSCSYKGLGEADYWLAQNWVQDPHRKATHYMHAHEKGCLRGTIEWIGCLLQLFRRGSCVSQRHRNAGTTLLQKYQHLDIPRIHLYLYVCKFYGIGVFEKNEEEALVHLRRASDMGDPYASGEMARHLLLQGKVEDVHKYIHHVEMHGELEMSELRKCVESECRKRVCGRDRAVTM